MAHDREVGGLRCSEVLGVLSEYLDRELPPDRVAGIDRHLRGCDWCERFGGDMAAVVRGLRERLGPLDPLDEETAERLRRRLEEETGSSG